MYIYIYIHTYTDMIDVIEFIGFESGRWQRSARLRRAIYLVCSYARFRQ